MYLISDGLGEEERIFLFTDPVTVTDTAPMDVPGEVNPLIEYLTQSQYYEASKTGVEQFGERQICPFGGASSDPVIPGVCNTTALVAGAVVLALTMFMGGR